MAANSKIEWTAIPGHPGYWASRDGQIGSEDDTACASPSGDVEPIRLPSNRLMRKHLYECKSLRVAREDCMNSQLLALATVLKMHQEFEQERGR